MGLKLLHELWRSDDHSRGATRGVMMVLCARASDKTRRVWLSLGSIARAAGVSKSSAQRCVKELCENGVLVRTGKVLVDTPKWSRDTRFKQYLNEHEIAPFAAGCSHGDYSRNEAGCSHGDYQ